MNVLKDTGQLLAAHRRSGPLVLAAQAAGYEPLLVEVLATRAWIEQESGVPAKAVEIYEKAVWSALAAHRDDIAAESAAMLVGITGCFLGQAQEAERWSEVGGALLQRLGPGHGRIASWFYQGRAAAEQRKDDYQAALRDLDLAVSLKGKVLAPNHPDMAGTLQTIANVRNQIGDHEAALDAANQAVEIYRNAFGPQSPLLAQPLGIRGETLSFLGRYGEADRDLSMAVEFSTSWVGADHPWTAYALTALGKTLTLQRRWQEANSALERALRIREDAEPNAELVAETRFALARVHWETRQDRIGTR